MDSPQHLTDRYARAVQSLERHAGMRCFNCNRTILDEGVTALWGGKCDACHLASENDCDRRI